MLLAIGGVAIAAVAGTVVADRQAKARLAEYDAEWRKALAAERERSAALRLPVLSGETLDGNAAAMYRTFCSTLKRADAGVVSSASSGPPLEGPLAPPCAKLLSDFKAVADSMRDATRCARCDWEIRYEDGLLSSSPSFHEARALALLLVLSAHEREGAGDVRGAAQDDLAACRFGVDLSHGTLIGHTMGAHAVKIALSAL
ncbi:hypothetical protein HY251_15240, partial [bacterium]|nr:hypothetical protein [bacterium]